jgi:hypothetical protein
MVDYVPDKRKNEHRGFASDLSIGDTFGKAWQVVQRWGWHFFGLGIVYAVIQAPASCMQYMLESSATQAGGMRICLSGLFSWSMRCFSSIPCPSVITGST